MYKFLCDCEFLYFWNKGPGVQLLGHMVVACFVFKKMPNSFPRYLCHFTVPPATCEWQLLSIMATVRYYHCVFLAVLISVWWYLVVILICISLMANGVEHLFMLICHLYITYLQWNGSLSLLPIFSLNCFLLLSFESSFYILCLSLLWDIWFMSISLSLWFAFAVCEQCLWETKVFNFNEVQFINFLYVMLLVSCLRTLFLGIFFFFSSLRFTAKSRGKCRDFPYSLCPHTCKASPTISITHQRVVFFF